MAHVCNPCYSGDGGQEDCGLRPAQAKLMRPLFKQNKLDVVAHAFQLNGRP
jgi:hypothetical protein